MERAKVKNFWFNFMETKPGFCAEEQYRKSHSRVGFGLSLKYLGKQDKQKDLKLPFFCGGEGSRDGLHMPEIGSGGGSVAPDSQQAPRHLANICRITSLIRVVKQN